MKENTSYLPIKNWHENDRPREKLLNRGKQTLSDAELLAILIGSGSKNESALNLAKRILASVANNLDDLGKLSTEQLTEFRGIGKVKAINILASLELGRRRRVIQKNEKQKIISSSVAFELLQPLIGELPHEEFWIIYLNNSNKVLKIAQISKGGITGTLVDVRLVLRQALVLSATSIILAHNHPSGILSPSKADKQLTKKLQTACDSLDIKVLDHLIVTEKMYFSFADRQLL